MCRSAYLDPPASAIAESAAREEDHEGYHQQQPEQRAHADPARDGRDYEDDQKQLQEPHGSLLLLSAPQHTLLRQERERSLYYRESTLSSTERTLCLVLSFQGCSRRPAKKPPRWGQALAS